jgi:two-component system chemotaxis sensor kinase CheA
MENETFLRLKVEKISSLQEVVGELGLAVLAVTQNSSFRNLRSQQLINNAHRLELLMRDVQDRTSSLRLVPVGELFWRMQRVVRDISTQTGKPTDLTLEGEETELDKAVLDQLGDPLIHLLRNAIDHGICSAEKRAERGTVDS